MKRWLILLLIGIQTTALSEKYIISELTKNEQKELVITLKIKEEKYLVKKGDTLKKIAKKFKMSIKELVRRNKIKNPDKLREGQLIIVDKIRDEL